MNDLKSIFEKYGAVVFFDTETTGLAACQDQIIELAALRVEQCADGTPIMAEKTDLFVKLPEGEKVPKEIVELTGITDEMLEAEGVSERAAAGIFEYLLRSNKGPVLLVAHNAQFDLSFILQILRRHSKEGMARLAAADYLDTLTVFKDRRPYPHKLANAITAYRLEGKVKNTHRAIDDVMALFEVCKAMDNERADLLNYVNLFGYNPKYGVSGNRIDGITYWPQKFNDYMRAPHHTLPAICPRRAQK